MFDIFSVLAWFRRRFKKRDILLILFLLFLYAATRFINLDRFPIFTDEGIYIRWAKVAWHDASWRFISLTDGKQPLQTWGTIPFLKLLPDNALLAGRLYSVFMGFVTFAGVFSLIYYLFGHRAAYFGTFLYVITPYFMFYDRLALQDSSVNAGFVWILFFSVLLAQLRRLDIAILFGLAAGIALLAKSSTRIYVMLSALAPLLFFEKNMKKFGRNAVNFFILFGISGALALIIYNVQRLSPFLHFVEEKNKTFVLTLDEWLSAPFQIFWPNLKLVPYFVFSESALLLPVLGLAGLYLLLKKDLRLGLYLTAWLILPYTAISLFGRIIYPRYLMFFAILFVVTAAYFLTTIKAKKALAGILIAFLLSVSYFDYTILFDHSRIPFPPVDRDQYIEGGASGFGIAEVLSYVRAHTKGKSVILIAEGNFGMTGDVLDVSVKPDEKITIRGYWPLKAEHIFANQKDLKDNTMFVLFYRKENIPRPPIPLTLLKTYQKPGGKNAFYLFELTPDNQ